MAELAEVVTEAVADVAEGVAVEALNVASVSRSLSGRDFSIGFIVGGNVIGMLSYWWLSKRLEKKYSTIAETEINGMREYFQKKQERVGDMVMAEDKPDLDKIVEERGYVPPPPGGLNFSVQEEVPKEAKSKALEELIKENPGLARDLSHLADTIVNKDPKTRMIERELELAAQGWSYEDELASRTPDRPYVIHEDEFKETGNTHVSLTFYEGDDVLCDDSNMPVDNKDQLVGDENLTKFGHGSNSPYLVYVRNESLNLDMEIARVSTRFVDEIQGLKHSDRRRSPRRVRFDDET